MTATLLAALLLGCLVSAATAARHWPTTHAALHWRFPHWWWAEAWCIHRHESIDWHIYNFPYTGGMQMLDQTFQSVGGRGHAADWSPREQLYRSYLVWHRDHGWSEWSTAGACHVG